MVENAILKDIFNYLWLSPNICKQPLGLLLAGIKYKGAGNNEKD